VDNFPRVRIDSLTLMTTQSRYLVLSVIMAQQAWLRSKCQTSCQHRLNDAPLSLDRPMAKMSGYTIVIQATSVHCRRYI